MQSLKHSLRRACGGGWLVLAVLVTIQFTGNSARGVTVDLSGQFIKQGGSFRGVSQDTVPAELLYDLAFTGTGTPTGDFVAICGTDSFAAAADMFGPECSPSYPLTIINISGKLPHTISAKSLTNYFVDIPLASGTAASFAVTATVKLSIDKTGHVHVSVSRLNFNARDEDNHRLLVTGTYTIGSGAGFTVVPSAPTGDGSATPTIIFPQGPFASPTTPGFTTPQFARIGRDASRTEFFILKNDGPNTDTFTLIGQVPNPLPGGGTHPWFSATLYDGRTNITTSVYDVHTGGFETPGTGYSIPDIPSGGTKLIKAVIHVGSAPRNSTGYLGFVLESATAGAESAIGQYQVFVP